MALLSICLLHHPMWDKQGKVVATALTAIDLHDISRTAATYGAAPVYIAHPSVATRKLAHTMHSFWSEGYGAEYNPNRKEALDQVRIVSDLDAVIHDLSLMDGQAPVLVATSAIDGPARESFATFRARLVNPEFSATRFVFMFGTGWGMTDELLSRAQIFLEPIYGPGSYNHLSVRSACAILMDRLTGKR